MCERTSEAPATFASTQGRATTAETLEHCAGAWRRPQEATRLLSSLLERDSCSGLPHWHVCAAPSSTLRVLIWLFAPSFSSSFSFEAWPFLTPLLGPTGCGCDRFHRGHI